MSGSDLAKWRAEPKKSLGGGDCSDAPGLAHVMDPKPESLSLGLRVDPKPTSTHPPPLNPTTSPTPTPNRSNHTLVSLVPDSKTTEVKP